MLQAGEWDQVREGHLRLGAELELGRESEVVAGAHKGDLCSSFHSPPFLLLPRPWSSSL